jgi:hypothetical protein
MPAFVNASNVRAFAGINSIDGMWSESNLGSNIRAASAFLQRATNRQFEAQTGVTKRFSTNGGAYINLPDVRTVSSVVLSGSTLVAANEEYHLIPDRLQSGVYIGMQFRPFGGRGGYRSFSNWFDTNKDAWWWPSFGSEAQDLSITGDWGHDPLPEDLLHATKSLAMWYTKRPDASLGNTLQTPEGNILDLSALPAEVTSFIAQWKLSSLVEAT